MKNKIFSIILIALLSLPITVSADDSVVNEIVPTQEQEQVVNTLENELKTIEKNEFKQPISKKKIAKKFFAAMSGVAISSFLLFFMLTLYNRVRENFKNKIRTPDGETSLETPQDINQAVKVFLNKTKWF